MCNQDHFIFQRLPPSPFWSLLPKTLHVAPPLSTQASGRLWFLDFVLLLLHLLWENSYSFFKAHQNPSSTRKPFFLTCLPSSPLAAEVSAVFQDLAASTSREDGQ